MSGAGETDLLVIGAGPAGLSAASQAARLGVTVTLLDEQAAPGGQIYRGVGESDPERLAVLGDDYAAGRRLLDGLAGVEHRTRATVWEVTRDRAVLFSRDGEGQAIAARRIVLCTGALERPMPFPGWTLPGVMTAGAGQILLKTSGLLPATPSVLAGSGPLLYLLAVQLLRAGHPIAALVETTPPGNRWAALKHLPSALLEPGLLRRGLGLLAELRRHGIEHVRGAAGLRAEGRERLERVSFRAGGARRRLDCAALLVHNGVVPDLQITRSLGLAHDWDPGQRCWRPRLDAWGGTGIAGIAVAGDGAGIAGAEAAVPAGLLAGLQAAAGLGAITEAERDNRALAARNRLARLLKARPFIDALYAPAPAFLVPEDATLVCRCEEVTAGAVRGYVKLGCLGPNQTKAFGRPGMGPCQGRFCALTVAEVIAEARGVPVSEVGSYRIRPPIKPVTLGELAATAPPDGPD